MSEKDYYPAGAYNDSNAPYNQVDSEAVDVEIYFNQTLSRIATVKTTDYVAEEWEDWEQDEEGHMLHSGGIAYDFSDTNFLKAYKDQELDILELLNYLKTYIKEDMDKTSPDSGKGKHLKRLLAACEGWEIIDEEAVQD